MCTRANTACYSSPPCTPTDSCSKTCSQKPQRKTCWFGGFARWPKQTKTTKTTDVLFGGGGGALNVCGRVVGLVRKGPLTHAQRKSIRYIVPLQTKHARWHHRSDSKSPVDHLSRTPPTIQLGVSRSRTALWLSLSTPLCYMAQPRTIKNHQEPSWTNQRKSKKKNGRSAFTITKQNQTFTDQSSSGPKDCAAPHLRGLTLMVRFPASNYITGPRPEHSLPVARATEPIRG